MAAVDIVSVTVQRNPAPLLSPFEFAITYEVRETLRDDIEWRVVYVGSAEDESHDQELEAVLLPADRAGKFAFVLETPAPDASRIPAEDATGVTIVLLTCAYRDEEFIRVGYYVNNEYPAEVVQSEFENGERMPSTPQWERIVRSVLADQPRVTRFPCAFDGPAVVSHQQRREQEGENDASGTADRHWHDASAHAVEQDVSMAVTSTAPVPMEEGDDQQQQQQQQQRQFAHLAAAGTQT